ncbi:MAG TPA: lysylphosphatidylglycerol synthase domain-containing protein [Stellaceae bacterium]|nr:lysylphosphatidylglycerol synthase domain-containing protein [Stellaceae bacterium]
MEGRRSWRGRLIPLAAALLGLALIAGLVVHIGAGAVGASLAAFGWRALAAIVVIHLVLIAVMGFAWRELLPETRAWVGVWGRLVRDSAAEVLPLSQLGGYVLGARALTLAGVSAAGAAGSTIVDVTLEFVAQLAYTALGLAWLIYLRPHAPLARPVAAGLLVAGLAAVGFLLVQHRGFALFDRLARAVGRGWADRSAAGAAALHAEIAAIYRRRGRLLAGLLLHFGCWIASAVESWLALEIAGAPLGFAAVLVIESLLYAIRTAAFAVPNALGVQEGAYILLGAGFGLSPEMALALSLLKRARDLSIGLPGLGLWQAVESRRLLRRSRRA